MSDYTTLPTYIIDDVQAAIENSDSEIAALRAENEGLKELGVKAGEEIKHLRSCIVDQADNKIEIESLRAENERLMAENRKLREVLRFLIDNNSIPYSGAFKKVQAALKGEGK